MQFILITCCKYYKYYPSDLEGSRIWNLNKCVHLLSSKYNKIMKFFTKVEDNFGPLFNCIPYFLKLLQSYQIGFSYFCYFCLSKFYWVTFFADLNFIELLLLFRQWILYFIFWSYFYYFCRSNGCHFFFGAFSTEIKIAAETVQTIRTLISNLNKVKKK